MKITFNEQAIKEAQRKQAEKNREAQQTSATSVGQTAFADMFGRQQDGILEAGEKGKSLIELQEEAGNVDVGIQRDYMTVVSHTMSEEDYAKMQEEGFDFGSMDPEEAVTIVDKIKAELVRAGKNIVGYTDDMDIGKLTAALGSEVLARSVVDSFREADVPLTKENLSAVSRAWNMNLELSPLAEGSYDYLIDNDMEAEIWNLYLAQSSGAGQGTSAPKFYAEDVQGYYTQSAGRADNTQLQGQIDRIIEQAGGQVNEKSRMNAAWLLDKGLPLTAENLKRLEALQDIQLPMTEERFAKAAAAAVAEGRDPVHASFTENGGNLYERAAAISEFYHSSELWEATVGDITARRQLEEVRLRMSAEVNVRLLRSGFSIDTEPMVELIEALKRAEYQLANQYFPRDNMAVEKYQNYQKASNVAGQLPGLPADVLGMFAKGEGAASLETIYNEGKALQASYEKAQASYEKLMTGPRSDLGDSIDKAFASVEHILKDLGAELTDENRRAVRILGYNQMEMNLSNLEAVRDADRQVQGVLEKLTPAATLKMIRDGFNPLEKSFGELEQYFKTLPPEYKKEADSYSRFLYGLERNNEITPEERESYIGIYRLVRQLEKAEGAAVGALVNAQTEIHFSNLLSALQSSRSRPLDMLVSDETGSKLGVTRKGESISSQISRAFNKTVREIREANAAAASIEEARFEAELKARKDAGAKEEQPAPGAGASAADGGDGVRGNHGRHRSHAFCRYRGSRGIFRIQEYQGIGGCPGNHGGGPDGGSPDGGRQPGRGAGGGSPSGPDAGQRQGGEGLRSFGQGGQRCADRGVFQCGGHPRIQQDPAGRAAPGGELRGQGERRHAAEGRAALQRGQSDGGPGPEPRRGQSLRDYGQKAREEERTVFHERPDGHAGEQVRRRKKQARTGSARRRDRICRIVAETGQHGAIRGGLQPDHHGGPGIRGGGHLRGGGQQRGRAEHAAEPQAADRGGGPGQAGRVLLARLCGRYPDQGPPDAGQGKAGEGHCHRGRDPFRGSASAGPSLSGERHGPRHDFRRGKSRTNEIAPDCRYL